MDGQLVCNSQEGVDETQKSNLEWPKAGTNRNAKSANYFIVQMGHILLTH